LIGLLMTVWHRQGRIRDALDLYQRAWASVVDEHGVEPGAELRSLHLSLLHDDRGPTESPRAAHLPAQLPAQAGGFTGRARELGQLDVMASKGPWFAGDHRRRRQSGRRQDRPGRAMGPWGC